MISVCFQGKPFNVTVIQVYAPTTNTDESELNGSMKTRPSRTNTKKKKRKKEILFIIGGWNAKVGSQEIPGVKASLAMEYKMKQNKE